MKSLKVQALILLFIALLTAGLAWFDYQHGATTPAAAVQKQSDSAAMQLPEFTVTPLLGASRDPIASSQLRGRFVLINAWASWCPPCVKEFPDLIALATEYPDHLVLLTLSADRNEQAAIDFLKQYGEPRSNMLHAFDVRQQIARDRLQIHRSPESILVDRQGQMIRKYAGLLRPEDLAEIRSLLAASAAK